MSDIFRNPGDSQDSFDRAILPSDGLSGLLSELTKLDEINPETREIVTNYLKGEQELRKKAAEFQVELSQKKLEAQIELDRIKIEQKTRGQHYGLTIGIIAILTGAITAIFSASVAGSVAGSIIGGGGVIGLVAVFVLGRRPVESQAEYVTVESIGDLIGKVDDLSARLEAIETWHKEETLP